MPQAKRAWLSPLDVGHPWALTRPMINCTVILGIDGDVVHQGQGFVTDAAQWDGRVVHVNCETAV